MRRKRITVIGLATFGEELARQLARAGAEVTALDMDPEVIQDIRDDVAHVGVVDGRDIDALREFDVSQSDMVFIGVRQHLEMSVLIILALQDLGVQHIVALASGRDEEKVMLKMGARRVIFPERDIARTEAQLILNPTLSRYFELAQGYSMAEIEMPDAFVGQSLKSLNVRMSYNVLVVAVRESSAADARLILPDPDYVFTTEARLLVLGPEESIRQISRMAD